MSQNKDNVIAAKEIEIFGWMKKQGYDRKASKDIAPIIVKYLEQQPTPSPQQEAGGGLRRKLTYTEAKGLIFNELEQFNDENENVAQTLFNVYSDEMQVIVKLLCSTPPDQESKDHIVEGNTMGEEEGKCFHLGLTAVFKNNQDENDVVIAVMNGLKSLEDTVQVVMFPIPPTEQSKPTASGTEKGEVDTFYDNWCEENKRDNQYLKRETILKLLSDFKIAAK